MTSGLCTSDPLASVHMDLSDSLDVRLMLSGRLSPATVQLRRDRAELSAVLGRPERSGVERPSDGHQKRGRR
jgi:hypothetical protein